MRDDCVWAACMPAAGLSVNASSRGGISMAGVAAIVCVAVELACGAREARVPCRVRGRTASPNLGAGLALPSNPNNPNKVTLIR